ncbi:MAG: XTP/dITP diphosphatase [Candidatus Thermoplasmatota archaeon]
MKKIYFITGNKGKVREAQKKLEKLGLEVIQKDLGYPEIQAEKLEEVADFGVEHISKTFDEPFILEDAGLFVNSLKGFPGVYSAFVFYTLGCEGILKLLESEEDRDAVFRSVYAFKKPGGETRLFVGECLGCISRRMRGDEGFGYDPIFVPDGSDKTFGEMKTGEKNSFSHRGKSLDKLIDFLGREL